MKTFSKLILSHLLLTTLFIGPVLAGGGKAPAQGGKAVIPTAPKPDKHRFRISAGASYRSLGSASFTTGSYSSGVRLPFMASVPTYAGTAGSSGGYADRHYRDGFVFRDGGTAEYGDTWYWGYDSPSQVQGDAINFHAFGGSETTSSSTRSSTPGGTWGEDITGAAPVVQLDWLYDVKPDLSVGFGLSWIFLGTDGSHNTSNFSVTQRAQANGFAIADRYALNGVLPPEAPYVATSDGPGPLIANKPSGRMISSTGVLAASSKEFTNAITESFDLDLHTISIGPTVEKRWGRTSMAFSGGLAIGVANYDLERTEVLYANGRPLQTWTDEKSGIDVLWGAYTQLQLLFAITPNWGLGASARYDWSEKLSTPIGPSNFQADPSGWSLGVHLGFAF